MGFRFLALDLALDSHITLLALLLGINFHQLSTIFNVVRLVVEEEQEEDMSVQQYNRVLLVNIGCSVN